MKSRRQRALWLGLTALWAGWLLHMTLTSDRTPNTNNLVPFLEHANALGCLLRRCADAKASLRYLIIDFAGNVAVFVPLGLGLAASLDSALRSRQRTLALAVLGGALLSLFIELTQLNMPTRAADASDVLLNGLGTALGAALLLYGFRRA